MVVPRSPTFAKPSKNTVTNKRKNKLFKKSVALMREKVGVKQRKEKPRKETVLKQKPFRLLPSPLARLSPVNAVNANQDTSEVVRPAITWTRNTPLEPVEVSEIVEVYVYREKHPINNGKTTRLIGKKGKKYHRNDILGPIVDSMALMYAKMGWGVRLNTDDLVDEQTDKWVNPSSISGKRMNPFVGAHRTPFMTDTTDAAGPMGSSSTPSTSSAPIRLCLGCDQAKERGDFTQTADKSHLVCKFCGAVAAPLHVATDREKNCAREEDKTTHADRPTDHAMDPFAAPLTASERRRQMEYQMAGTRISKKAKEKNGLGFAQELLNRTAASEEIERQRADMSQREYNKGRQVILELEKLFTPLEKVDEPVKRHCRKEADRLWRETIRHSRVCCSDTRCQFKLKDKSPQVIAQVSLACTLDDLSQRRNVLDGVSHGHIVSVNTKLRAQNAASVSCGYRAVKQIVQRLFAHEGPDPIPPCPAVSLTASPAASSSSCSSVLKASASDALLPNQNREAASDAVELLQLRDAIGKLSRHVMCGQSVQRATMEAIQNPIFRSSILKERLTPPELAYCLIDATKMKLTGVGVPPASRPSKLDLNKVEPIVHKFATMLPALSRDSSADDDDEALF